jgi:hypothetical protein
MRGRGDEGKRGQNQESWSGQWSGDLVSLRGLLARG